MKEKICVNNMNLINRVEGIEQAKKIVCLAPNNICSFAITTKSYCLKEDDLGWMSWDEAAQRWYKCEPVNSSDMISYSDLYYAVKDYDKTLIIGSKVVAFKPMYPDVSTITSLFCDGELAHLNDYYYVSLSNLRHASEEEIEKGYRGDVWITTCLEGYKE